MHDINQIDLDRFNALAQELVTPHVTQSQSIIRHPLNGRTVIYMGVKTHRCSMNGGDFDAQGSSPPSDSADRAAQQVADEFGLDVKWEEGEKGWGTFYWEAKLQTEEGCPDCGAGMNYVAGKVVHGRDCEAQD